MKFTTRHLAILILIIAALLATYGIAYDHGKAAALLEKNIKITHDEWQIITDDGLFLAIDRHCHYNWGTGYEAQHGRGIRWGDGAIPNQAEYYNTLQYYPYYDKFIGPKCELPILAWKLNMTEQRPDWEAIKKEKLKDTRSQE